MVKSRNDGASVMVKPRGDALRVSRRDLAGPRLERVNYYYQLLSYLSFRVVKRQLLLHCGILGQISWHGFFFKKVE